MFKKFLNWLKNELLKEKVGTEGETRDRWGGTLRDAFYNAALGGIRTRTRDTAVQQSHNTSNDRGRTFYKLFLGNDDAQAFYFTYLYNLPSTYTRNIRKNLSSQANKETRKLENFWTTADETQAKETNAPLELIKAGALSLAGIAGIKAKIKFMRDNHQVVRPWHVMFFISESIYNPLKLAEYIAHRIELGLRQFFQLLLARKKSELLPGESQTTKVIHLKDGGVIRNQIFYFCLLIVRGIFFVVASAFNHRLVYFIKKHPYVFAITFIVSLTIILFCLFSPPATLYFLGVAAKPFLAFLSSLTVFETICLTLFSVYIATAIARATSQLFEAGINLIVDLWFIFTDEKSFIAKHPIISVLTFVLLTTLFVTTFLLFVKIASPLLLGLIVFGLIDVAAMLSCKLCHVVDYFKEKNSSEAVGSESESETQIMKDRAIKDAELQEQRRERARQLQLQQQQASVPDIEMVEMPVVPNNINNAGIENEVNDGINLDEDLEQFFTDFQNNIQEINQGLANNSIDNQFNPQSDTLASLFFKPNETDEDTTQVRSRSNTAVLDGLLVSLESVKNSLFAMLPDNGATRNVENNNNVTNTSVARKSIELDAFNENRDRSITSEVNKIVNNLNKTTDSIPKRIPIRNNVNHNDTNNSYLSDLSVVNTLIGIANSSSVLDIQGSSATSSVVTASWSNTSAGNNSNNNNDNNNNNNNNNVYEYKG
ncbi:MAG: hypothetical protein WC748_04270 [Legionellales bacterium]|jgi:hypothetical protein